MNVSHFFPPDFTYAHYVNSFQYFRYDENWYLGESPQYGQPIILDGRSFDDGVELEISQDNGRQTVSRLQVNQTFKSSKFRHQMALV